MSFCCCRFSDSADFLCAGSILIGSAAGILHSLPASKLCAEINPEDMFAIGRGFCGDVANVLGTMAEYIAPRYGLEWKSFYTALDGHVVCSIKWDNQFYVFDPMLGKFFYTLDNKRLATLDEMCEIPEISYRVDCYNRAHGHEFYVGRDIQLYEFKRHKERLFNVMH